MGIVNTKATETTKIVFLDIDGVLNNAKSDISALFVVEKSLLQTLKRIIDETGAAIVLSSTWRYTEATRFTVANFLKTEGIPEFISCTSRLKNKCRTDEILCWLQDNTDFNEDGIQDVVFDTIYKACRDLPPSKYMLDKRLHVTHWIVLDDMDLWKEGENFTDRFILVDKMTGLTEKDADLAIRLLNK